MKKLLIITMLLAASTANAAMTEYETKMLQLETERLQLLREANAQAAFTGLYQRCAAIRTTSPFITLASCVAQGGTIDQPISSNDQNKPAAPLR